MSGIRHGLRNDLTHLHVTLMNDLSALSSFDLTMVDVVLNVGPSFP